MSVKMRSIKGKGVAYMAGGTVVSWGGSDTMRPSAVTVMVVALRTVVRTVAGTAVTAASDGGGDVVGCTSCDAEGGVR